MRVKIFKTLLLLQITAKSFQTSPEVSSQWSSQKYVWYFWNFEFPTLAIFFSKFQIYYCSLWRNQKPQLSGKRATSRAKGSENLDWRVVVQHTNIRCTFGLVAFKFIMRSFGAIWIFRTLGHKRNRRKHFDGYNS